MKIPYSSVNGPYHSWARPETKGTGKPGDPIHCSLCGAHYNTKQWSGPCPVRLKEFVKDEQPAEDARERA